MEAHLKLREKGHKIDCIMQEGRDRYHNRVRFGVYKLVKEAK